MKTLLSSIISAGASFGAVQLLSDTSPFLSLTIGSIVFLIIHLTLAPVTGAIDEQDMRARK